MANCIFCAILGKLLAASMSQRLTSYLHQPMQPVCTSHPRFSPYTGFSQVKHHQLLVAAIAELTSMRGESSALCFMH